MIYSTSVLIALLSSGNAYFTSHPVILGAQKKSSFINAHDTTISRNRIRSALFMSDTSSEIPLMTLRFINTPSGKDVVTQVEYGSNLLLEGDRAGVKLPRACRTGLCGSCTCELQDPLAIATKTNPRDGFATIRACSVKCFIPDGMTEMIVDVSRMSKKKKPTPSGTTA